MAACISGIVASTTSKDGASWSGEHAPSKTRSGMAAIDDTVMARRGRDTGAVRQRRAGAVLMTILRFGWVMRGSLEHDPLPGNEARAVRIAAADWIAGTNEDWIAGTNSGIIRKGTGTIRRRPRHNLTDNEPNHVR
jgi:hypothetical protein